MARAATTSQLSQGGGPLDAAPPMIDVGDGRNVDAKIAFDVRNIAVRVRDALTRDHQTFTAFFHTLDKSHDKKLQLEEVRDGMAKVAGVHISDAEAVALFACFDLDGNGTVEMGELSRAFSRLAPQGTVEGFKRKWKAEAEAKKAARAARAAAAAAEAAEQQRLAEEALRAEEEEDEQAGPEIDGHSGWMPNFAASAARTLRFGETLCLFTKKVGGVLHCDARRGSAEHLIATKALHSYGLDSHCR